MQKHRSFPQRLLSPWLLGLLLVLFSSVSQAATSCSVGGGISTIGSEYFAVADYHDGSYSYNTNVLVCSGGIVTASVTTQFDSTPASIIASNTNPNFQRVFRNSCGSHLTFVHKSFTGTIAGKSLTLANYPNPGTYPDIFGNELTSGAVAIACAPPPPTCKSPQILNPGTNTCINPAPATPPSSKEAKGKGQPQTCPSDGQVVTRKPINVGSGYKYWTESLYAGGGITGLTLVLNHTSRQSTDSYSPSGVVGANWVTDLDSKLLLAADGTTTSGPSAVYIQRPNGQTLTYTRSGTNYVADADVSHRLLRQTDASGGTSGWRLIDATAQTTETYDAGGKLLSLTDRNGLTRTLAYDTNNRVTTLTDAQGRLLTLGYDASNRINTVTQPDNGIIQLAYDTANNLSTVTWPDGKVRRYQYENASFPHNLTGITDENGVRFATYGYDSQGRATSETLAGGVDATTLSFGTNSTTVADALSTARTYTFQTILGVVKSTGSNQPAGSGCAASASALTYDANGNIATRSDFNGYKTTYTYDLSRNLATQRQEGLNGDGSTRPESRTISTQWHSYWRLPVKVAEAKKLTTYVYNGDTYNSAVVSCAPGTATVPSITGGTQPIGVLCQTIEQATTDTTGSQGFSATVTGTPRTWTYTYNDVGQVLTANGPRTEVNDTTTFTYYPANDSSIGKRGNLATVTNALGHVTQITAYDLNGRPLTVIDPNNVTLTFTYGPRGWLKTSTIDGQTTNYDYDNVGQLTAVTRPDGSKTTYGYDTAHRLTSVTDLKGNTVSLSLDNLGNVLSTTWLNPDGSTAKNLSGDYDALGRLQNAIETRNAVNYTTHLGYDANGNPTTTTDPKTQTTTTAYDALNRPTQVTDALSGLTTLAYDARDQLTQFKAPNNAQTSFTVDGLGNVTNEASADRGNLTATYDAAGNLLTLSDARSVVETHTYDALNRPLTVSYPTAGENRSYTWDAGTGCSNGIGRLCQVTDNAGSSTYAYDVRGNVVNKTRIEGGVTLPTMQYTWDGADRLVTEITTTGKILTTQRDSDGRIQQVSTAVGTTPSVNLVSAIQQNAAGAVTAQTFGNGVTEAKTFNTDGRSAGQVDTAPVSGGGGGGDADVPTLPEWAAMLMGLVLLTIGYRHQHRSSGGRNLISLLAWVSAALLALPLVVPSQVWADEALTYDANGNVQTRTLPGGATTYGYDALNRVNSEAGPAKTQSLTYDGNDNRISDGAGSKTYTANTDRIATENGVSISVDAAGNITQARGLTFVWNQAEGQIKTVSQGATLLATYYYDHLGLRTRKVTTSAAPQGAGTVIYVYDLYNRLKGELDGTGHPLRTYVWRDAVPVSIILHGTTETALYLETDHLGTPIAARDQSGKVVWKWESDAFGTTAANEDPDGDGTKVTINLRLPGQYYDKESGLHYNWRRYYDPRLGRYMSSDPIGLAGGGNTFSYTNANPLRYSDPEGLQAIPLLPPPVPGFPMPGSPSKPRNSDNLLENPSSSRPSPPPMPSSTAIMCSVSPAACLASMMASQMSSGSSSSASSSNSSNSQCKSDDKCEEQAKNDEQMCRMTTMPKTGARARCWASVQDRYGACKAGRPLPPLVMW